MVQVLSNKRAPTKKRESHARQCVDGSSPLYKACSLIKLPNPTHGSVWFVQVLSTKQHSSKNRNSTHGSVWMVQVLSNKRAPTKKRESHTRQCVDGSSPLYKACSLIKLPNPTHGSVWFVQVLSTKRTNF